MLDSRIIDLNLNPVYFRLAGSNVTVTPSISTVRTVDPQLASSLSMLQKYVTEKNRLIALGASRSQLEAIAVEHATISDLSLDFTLPGHPAIELVENGSHIAVNIDNVERYLELVVDMTLGSGVEAQIDSFTKGFSEVFPYSALFAFTPEELVVMCGQGEEDWTYSALYEAVTADHGYAKDSRTIKDILSILSEFDTKHRRAFLQFMTGSPNLPIGGFKSLNPRFTIVLKHNELPLMPDDYLPSVMTCANYLKLPNYSSKAVLKKRLLTAIFEGTGAFLLS